MIRKDLIPIEGGVKEIEKKKNSFKQSAQHNDIPEKMLKQSFGIFILRSDSDNFPFVLKQTNVILNFEKG